MPTIGTRISDRGDADLITACLAGDEDAWAELLRRYSRLVYSIAFKSGLTADDAADVAQNVFTIVLRRLESLHDVDRFSAWLITTTHRESWRYKKQFREHALDDAFDPVDDEPGAPQQVIAWEQASIVHRALGDLGGRCQRLIQMLFLDDPRPSYELISADLGISVGSIGPTRSRCLKKLKGQLAHFGVDESSR